MNSSTDPKYVRRSNTWSVHTSIEDRKKDGFLMERWRATGYYIHSFGDDITFTYKHHMFHSPIRIITDNTINAIRHCGWTWAIHHQFSGIRSPVGPSFRWAPTFETSLSVQAQAKGILIHVLDERTILLDTEGLDVTRDHDTSSHAGVFGLFLQQPWRNHLSTKVAGVEN